MKPCATARSSASKTAHEKSERVLMFVEYALRLQREHHLVRRRDERVADHLERDGVDHVTFPVRAVGGAIGRAPAAQDRPNRPRRPCGGRRRRPPGSSSRTSRAAPPRCRRRGCRRFDETAPGAAAVEAVGRVRRPVGAHDQRRARRQAPPDSLDREPAAVLARRRPSRERGRSARSGSGTPTRPPRPGCSPRGSPGSVSPSLPSPRGVPPQVPTTSS